MRAGDSLGDRMKRYEHAWRVELPRRVPVIIRVDGKAFHTLTRRCTKPFDESLMCAMDAVAIALCEEVQGAQLAYVQSDEVSVLVHGYRTIQSEPWFNNELQKMCSVSASVATAAFNGAWIPGVRWLVPSEAQDLADMNEIGSIVRYTGAAPEYIRGSSSATFDSRVFVLPEDEVCNYFIWRQQDATRNSIQMVARAHFSHREVDGQNTSQMQEMLHAKGINWNDLAIHYRRGRCAVRESREIMSLADVAAGRDPVIRHQWALDVKPPIFTQDRNYIERHVRIHRDAASDAPPRPNDGEEG